MGLGTKILVWYQRYNGVPHDHHMWDFAWLNINGYIHRRYMLIDVHIFWVRYVSKILSLTIKRLDIDPGAKAYNDSTAEAKHFPKGTPKFILP